MISNREIRNLLPKFSLTGPKTTTTPETTATKLVADNPDNPDDQVVNDSPNTTPLGAIIAAVVVELSVMVI